MLFILLFIIFLSFEMNMKGYQKLFRFVSQFFHELFFFVRLLQTLILFYLWWKKLPRIICIFKHFLVRHRKVTKVYEWLVSVYVVIKWSNNPFSTNLFLVFTVETTGYYVFGLIIIQGAVVKSGAWLYAAGTLGVVHGLFYFL